MDNTQLILLLAVGGLGFYVLSKDRQEPEVEERIVMKERKLSKSEALGGAVGNILSAFDELSFG